MLTLVQLQAFIAVAEELHFGAAASRLSMTQPPLSRQIQMLEKDLGASLFRRSSRRVELTPAGETLLPRAREMIALAERASIDVRRVASGTLGTVTVGHTTMAALSLVPELLARVRDQLPEVRINLHQMVSSDQMQSLRSGDLDLGFLRVEAGRRGLASRVVIHEPLVAAVHASSPLARPGRKLAASELAAEPLLMYDLRNTAYMHGLVQRLFTTVRVRPRVAMHADQIPVLLSLVSAEFGYAIVPQSAARWAVAGVEFRELDIPGAAIDATSVRLEAAWREGDTNPALHEVLALIPESD
ncbi:LysR substrate-binding domain-containing protein [uncultured Demequina sp.]|uniref:LysR substrate-binding domain-containing protein n=1 Tax=uncultured Demequina sp. TaxID=693499 RepID=UPI0025CF61CB|nr:LysR substrate-binding domain-containing protein [uncultured Demequina sp.]